MAYGCKIDYKSCLRAGCHTNKKEKVAEMTHTEKQRPWLQCTDDFISLDTGQGLVHLCIYGFFFSDTKNENVNADCTTKYQVHSSDVTDSLLERDVTVFVWALLFTKPILAFCAHTYLNAEPFIYVKQSDHIET